MNSIRESLKFLGGTVFKKWAVRTSGNILNIAFFNNKIRLLSSQETAVVTFKLLKTYRKRRYDAGSWALLVIPASAFGLGTWQVFRKFEKDKLANEFWEKVSRPPIDLPKNLAELEDMEFQRVRVKGKFDHSKEMLLGPRSKIDEFTFKRPASLLSVQSGGYLLVTPFKLSDRNLTILVNRGWIPNEKIPPSCRLEGQIEEEVELTGYIRFQERRRFFVDKKALKEEKLFSYRDVNKMAEVAGTSPIFIDADDKSTLPGGPLGGQSIVEFRNEHLSYIYTWYGLATASGYMWYLRHFKKPFIIV